MKVKWFPFFDVKSPEMCPNDKDNSDHEKKLEDGVASCRQGRGDVRAGRRRLSADVVGVELLADGTALAVGLRKGNDKPKVAFARLFESADELAGALTEGKLKCRALNVCIPGHRCASRRIRLPSTEPREIRSMVEFEAERLIPFAEGKTVHAFTASNSEDSGYTDALVFLTQESIIQPYIEPLLRKGLMPDRILPAPMALLGWARAMESTKQDDRKALVLVVAAAGSVDVVALLGDKIAYSRGIAAGTRGIREDPKLLGQLATSVSHATASLGRKPDSVRVAVAQSDTEYVAAELGRRLALELGDGASAEHSPRLEPIGSPVPDGLLVGEGAAELSGAMVRALGAAAIEFVPELSGFSMLPESLSRVKRRSAFRKQLVVSLILSVALLGLAAALAQQQIHKQRRRIQAFQAQIAPIKDMAVALHRKKEQMKVLDAHVSDRDLPLMVLTELYRLTPSGIHLVGLEVTGTKVRITGQAESAGQAYSYPSVLMGSKVLGGVLFHGAHPVSVRGGSVTEFSCSCSATIPDDLGEDP